MKQIATILFSFLLVFILFGTAQGQTTLYSDDFTGEDNKGKIGTDPVDLSGVDWTIDVTGGDFTSTNDIFGVQSGVFEAINVDGDVIWESESFSISGSNNLEFSFDAAADGDFEASSDIFDVEIIIDSGSPQTLFSGTVDENAPGDPMLFGSTELTNTLQNFTTGITGTGTNAFIRITVNNNVDTEIYKFDNLEVTELSSATKLTITDINGGNPLYEGVAFDVVIQAQDGSGNPRNVSSNVNLTLSKNTGNGSLGGILTGTITSGTSQTTISDITYDTAESGVIIQVEDDASSLTTGTSNSLTFTELTIVLNEFLADPGGNDVNLDGTSDNTEDEFIEFVNTGTTDLDISGWTIEDPGSSNSTHTFTSTILKPNQAVIVFGDATGTLDSDDFGGAIVQTVNTTSSNKLSLNNGGDDIILLNNSGNELIKYTYSSSSSGESETRDPDLTGNFTDHTSAFGGTSYSPGTRMDGFAFHPRVEITGNEGWRMLSTPTSDNKYHDLLNNIWTQCSGGADYNGASCNTSDEPNVQYYDKNTDQFEGVSDLDGTGSTGDMTTGQGFIVYVYSDDDFDSSPDGFPKTLEMFGTENSGTIDPTLNTGSESATLVGNPFLVPIDWDDLTKTDLKGTTYVYDDLYGSISGAPDEEASGVSGSYRAWSSSLQTGSLTDGLIAPLQAFWVINGTGTPSPDLKMSRDATIKGGSFYKRIENGIPKIQLRAENKYMFNEAYLSFSPDGLFEKDYADGYELTPLDYGDYISLSTEVEGTQMDINNLPVELYNPVEIPLHVQAFEAVDSGWSLMGGEVTISWPEMNNIPSEWDITLTDTKLNRTIDLNSTNNYVFEAEGSRAKIANKEPFSPFNPKPFQKEKTVSDARFLITINPNVPNGLIDDDIPNQFALEQNYPNPFNPATNIKFEIAETSDVTLNVYNVMGQRIATLVNEVKAPGTYEIAWDAQEMASGIYYYRLRAGGVVFNKQMTLIK